MSGPQNDTPGTAERDKLSLVLLVVSGLLAVLLQTSLTQRLPIVPDFLLILCVYLGINHRSVGGAAAAFFLGYSLDSCSGAPVGTNAFAMSLVFAMVSAIARQLWLNNPVAVLCMVFLGVVLKTSAVLLLTDFGRFAFLVQPMVARYIMWDATVAMLVTPVVFTVLYRGELADYEG